MATTAFEDSGNLTLTTYAQELSYVDDLVAEYPTRLTKVPVVTSTQGRQVYALRVGSPSATGAPLLVEATIHGNEVAPRETALIFARQMAATTDPALIGLMDDHPLYVIPCMNPDGFPSSRTDSTGVDLNRSVLNLIRPEIKALAEWVRDNEPAVILSGHEHGHAPKYEMDICNLSGCPEFVTREGFAAIEHSVFPAVEATGATTSWYTYAPDTIDTSVWRVFGLRGIVMFLSETRHAVGEVYADRVTWGIAAWNGWMQYLSTNIDRIVEEAALSRTGMGNRLALGNTTWHDSGFKATPTLAASIVSTVTASGYVVTAAQWASTVTGSAPAFTVEELFEAHGITTVAYGADRWVPLGQPLAPLIVRLIDDAAENNVITATRTATTPAQFAQPGDVWQ